MSAYQAPEYAKLKIPLKKQPDLSFLLRKHHLNYIFSNGNLTSTIGVLKLAKEYDCVKQSTSFSFTTVNKNQNINDFKEIIGLAGRCVNLLHAQSVLSDTSFFNIDVLVSMESFLVYVDNRALQINPIIFSLGYTFIVCFEVIDFKSGNTLRKDDILGQVGNYNLLTATQFRYFNDDSVTACNDRISKIIYENVSSFFSEIIGKNLICKEYYSVYNTLVLSNEIDDISDYFCTLICCKELPLSLKNISTTDNYKYYLQDGASIITAFNPNEIDTPLCDGIILEAIKLYVYLFQLVNLEETSGINNVIKNNLYLENLFFSPYVPIETQNLLNCVYNTNSFLQHKEAIKLKISYLTAENESKKNRNSVLLNVLLYVISLIGTISTLDSLESHLHIPFRFSLIFVVLAFSLFGVIWIVSELRRNRRF